MTSRPSANCAGTMYWLILVATGCARPPVITSTPSVTREPQPIKTDSTRGSTTNWDIYQAGSIQYDYRLTSTVQVLAGDSIPRTDSTRMTAVLVATFSDEPTHRFTDVSIKADSIRLTALPATPSAAGNVLTEFHTLRLDQSTKHISTSRSPLSDCTETTVDLMLHGDEVVPALPQQPTIRSWADSSVFELCRAGVKLQFNRIARYRLDDMQTLTDQRRVFRAVDLQISGSGIQWQQPVQVTGTGTSVDTLVFAQNPIRLRAVSGMSQINLEFRSPTRRQQFNQKSSAVITAR
jgi:hypothetical protein